MSSVDALEEKFIENLEIIGRNKYPDYPKEASFKKKVKFLRKQQLRQLRTKESKTLWNRIKSFIVRLFRKEDLVCFVEAPKEVLEKVSCKTNVVEVKNDKGRYVVVIPGGDQGVKDYINANPYREVNVLEEAIKE